MLSIQKARRFLLACIGSATLSAAGIFPIHAADSYAMNRLYNPNTGEHFYTASSNEAAVLSSLGWRNEGKGWNAPTTGWYVWRLYNPNAGDHHYTMDEEEKNALVSIGWRDEGAAFASPDLAWTPVKEADGIPVYRLYNPNSATASHHYTTSVNEANALLRLGWRYEGVGWYALS